MTAAQIENRNFLAPTGFKFSLERSPKVSFFCNQANIPDLNLGVAVQPTYLKDIDLPGDKISFGDLNLRFLVDENMENYMEIQNWIRGLGYPEDLKQYRDLASKATISGRATSLSKSENVYSDGTLQVLGSSFLPIFQVRFKGMFPYSLQTLVFDATETDINYFTAEVSFKYTIYNIVDLNGNDL